MSDAPRLRDGTEIRIRPVAPDDQSAMLAFMQELSPESRRLRLFTPASDLYESARWAAGADGTDHIGIVALDTRDRILAHAACVRMYGARAEVAVEVDETHRHQGLATLLITKLAREAEQKQIRHFVVEVLPDDFEMLSVCKDGFRALRRSAHGEVGIEVPTAAWQLSPCRLVPPQSATHAWLPDSP